MSNNEPKQVKVGNRVITAKLSHCLKSVSNGNTRKSRHSSLRNRARTWCFTLNNYTEEDIVSLSHNKWENIEITKYVFQEEIGLKKTKHLQGVVQFKNQISFTSLKEFHNKIRWSKCKNLKASIKYCSKQDTRNGEIYKYGDVDKYIWKDKIKETLIPHVQLLENMCKQMKEESIWKHEKLKHIDWCVGEPGNGGHFG